MKATETSVTLYVPSDVETAYAAWKANCGPCAVAAVLGREVNDVRELFVPWPGYTNPTAIRRAFERAGRRVTPNTEETVQLGVGFVQFEGPWEKGGARAAYRHTHWVGLARRHHGGDDAGAGPVLFVYDAAVGASGGWVQVGAFSALIVPLYLADEPGATGWRFRQVLAVSA